MDKELCTKCHDFDYSIRPIPLDPHKNAPNCSLCHPAHKELQDDNECIQCHPIPFTSLKENGSKHSMKACAFCHPSHGYVMECGQCHGPFHQGVFVDCKECHSDAHKPGDIGYEEMTKNMDICLLCHENVNTTFFTNPSNHSNLECKECHASHREIEQCSSCHNPHGKESNPADCFVCHSGHTPGDVEYSTYTSSSLCLECHEQTGNNVLNSNTGHAQEQCARCHPNHGQIPICSNCHGRPAHADSDEGCERCHVSAHELLIP